MGYGNQGILALAKRFSPEIDSAVFGDDEMRVVSRCRNGAIEIGDDPRYSAVPCSRTAGDHRLAVARGGGAADEVELAP